MKLFILVSICFITICGWVVRPIRLSFMTRMVQLNHEPIPVNTETFSPLNNDTSRLLEILNSISKALDENIEAAIHVASQNIDLLLANNIPELTAKLVDSSIAGTDSGELMRIKSAVTFLTDFVEAVVNVKDSMVKNCQAILRMILDASKVSEQALDDVFHVYAANVSSPDFLLYLDAEIDRLQDSPQLQTILTSVKLRALDEAGKKFGPTIRALPALISEMNPSEIKRQTFDLLGGLTLKGRQEFIRELEMMQQQLKNKYQEVDPRIPENLAIVEQCTKEFNL